VAADGGIRHVVVGFFDDLAELGGPFGPAVLLQPLMAAESGSEVSYVARLRMKRP
jgi:hypothetical protein